MTITNIGRKKFEIDGNEIEIITFCPDRKMLEDAEFEVEMADEEDALAEVLRKLGDLKDE